MISSGADTPKAIFLVLVVPAPLLGTIALQQSVHHATVAHALGLTSATQSFHAAPFSAGIADYAWPIAAIAAITLSVSAWAWWKAAYRVGLVASIICLVCVAGLWWTAHRVYDYATTCLGTRWEACPVPLVPMGNDSIQALVLFGLAGLAALMTALGCLYRLWDAAARTLEYGEAQAHAHPSK